MEDNGVIAWLRTYWKQQQKGGQNAKQSDRPVERQGRRVCECISPEEGILRIQEMPRQEETLWPLPLQEKQRGRKRKIEASGEICGKTRQRSIPEGHSGVRRKSTQ